jgi:TolB-like protein
MRFLAGLLLAVVCIAGSAGRVSAEQASVVVLGLRSLEGDDDFSNAMTEGLRGAAKNVSDWRLIERSVSMAQMTLAHSCDDVDAACLNEIAKGLEAERVIFGTIRRTAARGKFDYEITVSIFNATTHTIVDTQTDVIPKPEGKQKKTLAARGQTLIGRLAAADVNAGRLLISVNVSTAEVNVDGKWVGRTQDGKLALDNIDPGEHTLEVSAGGHQLHTQRLSVSASEQSSVDINLQPFTETPLEAAPEAVAAVEPADEAGAGSLRWLGYSLIGVGAASAIAWGASMYVIEFNYNRDASYRHFRDTYGSNQTLDACDAALGGAPGGLNPTELGQFQGQCRTARTFQVLQWVFLGAAVVTGGAGTYVLLNESSNERAQAARAQRPRLAFTPVIDRRSLALQATLRF